MAIYVDDLNLRADVPDGARRVHGKWSHLFADTEEELRAFARKIGLKENWIQHPGETRVHFDVVSRMRQRAIAAGATPVTWREAGEFFAARTRQALIPADEPVDSLLLITGPREGVTKETVRAALQPKFSTTTMLVTGSARGVDTYAAQLWREWGGPVEEHKVPAGEWNRDPRRAGFARNGRMVQRVKTAGGSVLAIDLPCTKPGCARAQPHNTHGTGHCAGIAEQAGLPVEHHPATPAGRTTEPRQQRARHSWEPAADGTKRCTRDGCGLEARQWPHPTERRWLTSYTKDGRTIIAQRVPACGDDLPQARGADEMRQLATDADRQAGHAFRAGDIDRAYRLLADARVLDPARHELWGQREKQIRASVARRQPRQVSQSTETASCPDCDRPYVRPVGETYPCLDCETHARLKAAGFTADSPQIRQITEWNHLAISRSYRQQEIPQPRPAREPQTLAIQEHSGHVKVPDPEKEACD